MAVNDSIVGWLGACEMSERGEPIHRGGDLITNDACGNVSRPARNTRHPHRAFGSIVAPALQRSIAPLGWILKDRAVVRSPNDKGVVVQTETAERGQDFTR